MAEYRAAGAGKGPKDLKWVPFDSKGDAARAADGEVFEATYDFPYLAHAAMEPMDCVAIVKGSHVKLIHGSQSPTMDQLAVAKIVKTLPGSIEVETLLAGGSFGRRTNFQADYVAECVHIAKKLPKGTPLKLVWTREDDMRAGYFRPITHHNVRIVLDKDGYPAVWRQRVVTQSLMKGSPIPSKGDLDATAVEGALGSPYLKATPVVDAQLATPDVGVPVLWWRSVGATHTAHVMEHTIDQLARKAGKDPVEYRRVLYQRAGAKRHLAVLNLAMEKADRSLPDWRAAWPCTSPSARLSPRSPTCGWRTGPSRRSRGWSRRSTAARRSRRTRSRPRWKAAPATACPPICTSPTAHREAETAKAHRG